MPIKSNFPMFEEYDLKDLAERLKYTRRYLLDIDEKRKPLNPQFVFRACGILKRSKQALFGIPLDVPDVIGGSPSDPAHPAAYQGTASARR